MAATVLAVAVIAIATGLVLYEPRPRGSTSRTASPPVPEPQFDGDVEDVPTEGATPVTDLLEAPVDPVVDVAAAPLALVPPIATPTPPAPPELDAPPTVAVEPPVEAPAPDPAPDPAPAPVASPPLDPARAWAARVTAALVAAPAPVRPHVVARGPRSAPVTAALPTETFAPAAPEHTLQGLRPAQLPDARVRHRGPRLAPAAAVPTPAPAAAHAKPTMPGAAAAAPLMVPSVLVGIGTPDIDHGVPRSRRLSSVVTLFALTLVAAGAVATGIWLGVSALH